MYYLQYNFLYYEHDCSHTETNTAYREILFSSLSSLLSVGEFKTAWASSYVSIYLPFDTTLFGQIQDRRKENFLQVKKGENNKDRK